MALIQCSVCSGTFDDSRQHCPGCGFRVPTQDGYESSQEKRPDADLFANAGYRIGPPSNELDGFGKYFLGVCCLVFGVMIWRMMAGAFANYEVSWEASSRSKPPNTTAAQEFKPKQKIADLDRGKFGVRATAPTQSTLARLSAKYGMSEKLIAAKLLVAKELLAKKHVHMTALKIADSIEEANPTTLPVPFDELLALFVTLCDRPDEVVHQSYDGEIDPAESRKRKIFFELVVAQDAGVGDERAYFIIAERYNIPEETVREIAIEGVKKKWPMP